MSEGYHYPRSDRYARLDEFLCDYVDGTMDPAARIAFEDYLRANPDLEEHVRALSEARTILCRYGCGRNAPHGFQHQLRRQLAHEIRASESSRLATVAPRLGKCVALASGMAVVLMLGMFVGATLFTGIDPAASPETALSSTQAPVPRIQKAVPRWRPKYQNAQLSAVGPMTVMPALVASEVAQPTYPLMADTLTDWMALKRTRSAP